MDSSDGAVRLERYSSVYFMYLLRVLRGIFYLSWLLVSLPGISGKLTAAAAHAGIPLQYTKHGTLCGFVT